MIYTLLYDDVDLAEVEIKDTPIAAQAIKEMVEFWSGWERRLAESGGDYTQCWLKQLAMELLEYGREGLKSEGWHPLDGSMDTTLNAYWKVDTIDDNLITIAST